MNDLINAKINNCEIAKRTEEKKYEIIKYFLNLIQKMNDLLYNIDKQNEVSYQDIFINAEYGKQDKKAIEKLREKGIKISKDDEEYFRMVNDFIGSNLDKIKFININEIINQIGSASENNKKKLIIEFELSANKNIKNIEIKPNKFIVYGVYKFDRSNNTSSVEKIITYEDNKIIK
jgi:biotin operon repressor